MDYIIHLLQENWQIAIGIGIPGLSGVVAVCRWLICKGYSEPKIMLVGEQTVGFNPTRTVYTISIYNEALKSFGKFIACRRHKVKCWIEAYFIVNDDFVLLGDGWSIAIWDSEPNHITLEADSTPYTIELISKLRNEKGFHIKRPTTGTLMTVEDVLAVVLVKTAQDKIIGKGAWAISDTGKESWDLHIERLE